MTPAQIEAERLFADMARATTLAEYTPAWAALEGLVNREYLNCRLDSSNEIHERLVAMSKIHGPRVAAIFDAQCPYSKANWPQTKARQSQPRKAA